MLNQIYAVFHCAIDADRFSEFEYLVREIVSASEHEADTLTYEYVVNSEKTEVHIIERYVPTGILSHIKSTFAPFAQKFLEIATIKNLYVYGEVSPEIKEVLDGFGAQYFVSFAGFTR